MNCKICTYICTWMQSIQVCLHVYMYMFTCLHVHIQLMIKNEKDILKCNTIKQFWSPYFVSLSSMAKARTVRTLPRASSATAVALATCAWAALESLLKSEPNKVPLIITTGRTITIMAVSLGEIKYSETTHPIVCVVLRRPWEITCLNALLKSWTSDVNLQEEGCQNQFCKLTAFFKIILS